MDSRLLLISWENDRQKLLWLPMYLLLFHPWQYHFPLWFCWLLPDLMLCDHMTFSMQFRYCSRLLLCHRHWQHIQLFVPFPNEQWQHSQYFLHYLHQATLVRYRYEEKLIQLSCLSLLEFLLFLFAFHHQYVQHNDLQPACLHDRQKLQRLRSLDRCWPCLW